MHGLKIFLIFLSSGNFVHILIITIAGEFLSRFLLFQNVILFPKLEFAIYFTNCSSGKFRKLFATCVHHYSIRLQKTKHHNVLVETLKVNIVEWREASEKYLLGNVMSIT